VTVIHLQEGAAPIPVSADRVTMERLQEARVLRAYPMGGERWEVSDAGRIGVVRLDGLTVWVRPKIPIARLLWLLGYAKNPGWISAEPVGYEQADELVPVLAAAFASQAEQALQTGLLQGYVELDEEGPVLRGRLRESDQLRERFGLAVPLLVRYDDFTTDIAENQILRAATERLLVLPGVDATTRTRLLRTRRRLAEVTVADRRHLPAWVPSRLNTRYHDALRLAEIVCAGDAVDQAPGSVRLDGFLVNMAKVFEDFVSRVLTDALVTRGGHCRSQDRWHLDEAGEVAMRPDLVWYLGAVAVAVMDAKYKAEKPDGFPDADLYQLLAYATALGLGHGHLVYAKGNEAAQRWKVRNARVTIVAHTLDLAAPPVAILGQVAALADRIAGTVPSGWSRPTRGVVANV
jgi:5-methylcytosine-specific restriction enzyme subunit McrC